MTAAAPRPNLVTADDLARLPGDLVAEIIDGELIEKALPSFEHGAAQSGLVAQIFGPYSRCPGGKPPGGWWIGTEIEVAYEERHIYRHDVVG